MDSKSQDSKSQIKRKNIQRGTVNRLHKQIMEELNKVNLPSSSNLYGLVCELIEQSKSNNEEANKELLSALKEIKKHTELGLGGMAEFSAVWSMASKAIAKHEVSDV